MESGYEPGTAVPERDAMCISALRPEQRCAEMIRLPNLTTAGLLDHIEAFLLRTACGRRSLPMRAYLADAGSWGTLIDVASPTDAA